ncbi:MAG TPA: tetratricopeptide repeat protein, partial [Hyphomicrobiaceae bacterium]|nr:tetratricopeptide repeat protein [Hyphomicrobiaceae bacterium]
PSFTEDGELRVRQTWRGVAAEAVRVMQQHLPREQLWKSYNDAMESRYPGARPLGQHSIDDDQERNVVTVNTAYTIPKMATERDGSWYIRYTPSNLRGALAPPQSATRVAPLQLPSFPFSAAYTFEVTLPDSVRVVADPHVTAVKNKHFTYTLTNHFRGNRAKTTVELRVTRDQVAPGDLKQYADDVRAIDAARVGLVFIPRSAIKAKTAKKDLTALLHERLKETIAQTTKAIKAGKLGAKDLAGAYCLRSAAHENLGSSKEALADANAALKLTPQSPETLHCRGGVYFALGDYDKAIADYSKAITLGATEATIKQRGVARFYAGQLEAAAEDFAKASELSDKEEQVYSDLWLAWTLQRLGKTLPDDLIKRAGADPRGSWPRPALALYSGDIKPDELMRMLERKTDDEGKMAAAEGYFYLGQYYLGRGDTAKARALFKKTRAVNVLIYVEHKAAELELKRLPPATQAEAEAEAAAASPPAAKRKKKQAADSKARRPAATAEDWRKGVFAR